MSNYLSITPVRDEERFLPGLIASMVSQTRRPERWLLIDDGSADATPAIIEEAARVHRWIEPRHLPRERVRRPGGESVIMQFLPPEAWRDVDFIARFDADLTFDSDYIERLLAEFARQPRLGIASGTLLEPGSDGAWREVVTPTFHTRGPSKLYSRPCFAAIGGLEPGLGWDTIDEIRAIMHGFVTRSFRHIHAWHHRPTGSARGMSRGRFNAGRAAYQAGYSPVFMGARVLRHLAIGRPLQGVAMLAGFADGYLRRAKRAASPDVVRFVRTQQMRRLFAMESRWR
jgi:glycosyltransferase involved in cell wall biosynthesis